METFTKPPLTRTVRRQHWMTSESRQLALCVCDASASMTGKKSEDAHLAVSELIKTLAEPYNKDGFYNGIIHFSETAQVTESPIKATQLASMLLTEDLKATHGCNTNITLGLESAYQVIEQFKNLPPEPDVDYLKPVVLLYTDGQHNTGPKPDAIAAKLKQYATLVTIAFGGDADENLLKSIATSPQHFCRCKSGQQLRSFLQSVGDTLTKSRAKGKNASAHLANITQQ